MNLKMWVVRAGLGARYVDEFLDGDFVGVGFSAETIREEGLSLQKEELLVRVAEARPERRKRQIMSDASQLARFLHEVRVGEWVLTPDTSRGRYVVGKVDSDPYFDKESDFLQYRQKVKWTHHVLRSSLKVSTRNSLGAIQTLFLLPDSVREDVMSRLAKLDDDLVEDVLLDPDNDEDESVEFYGEQALQQATQFIEDAISRLEPYEMQELIGGILRAMGYKTRIAPPGPDRGVDVFASPDGLGLQEPRIFVEVKHRPGSTMGAQEVRAFMGGRQSGDRCLYVSTGGFSKEARYEADRSSIPLTLISLPELRELLVEQYDNLDPETRALVPLKRIYWPAVD